MFIIKKFVAALLSIVLAVALTGCGSSADNQTSNTQSTNTQESNTETSNTSSTSTTDTTETAETEKAPETTSQGAKIPLTYMAWNLGTVEENNIERQMLAKFEANNPDVELTVFERPKNADGTDADWVELLTNFAAQKNLPDVYMEGSLPDNAGRNWARNISEYMLDDPEFLNVVEPLREAVLINNHAYAVPYAMFLMAVIQNFNIFEELNVEPLPYTYTFEDMLERIADTTTDRYRGVEAINLQEWGSFVLNKDLGVTTFDGEKYNFSSPAFAEIVDIYKELFAKRQNWQGTPEQLAEWTPEGVDWAWGDGYIAIKPDGSWGLGGITAGHLPFKGDMVPFPNEQIMLAMDFIFVSETSKNPDKAYELAKWMSFSEEGMKHRIEIIKKDPKLSYTGLPLAAGAYPEIDEYYVETVKNFPNFVKMYESLSVKPENVHVSISKVIPGYWRSVSDADTGVVGKKNNGTEGSLNMGELLESIYRGDRNLADYASELDRIANTEYQKAMELLKNK